MVLALTGACADGDRQGTPSASTRPDDGVRSLDARPAERAGPPAAERPVSVRLPSGTVVPVRAAGTRGRGLLDVPDDVTEAGWWRTGARLGDPFGSTLIAGHVDAVDQGLGSFAELLAVREGQRLRVRSRGLEQTFAIRSRELVLRSRLRDATRIYSVRGPRRLTLVTCAPPYLADRGGYQNLAVVTAVPVGPPHARSRA
ncbi:hypothetical protein GCM10023350_10660 [Nocardioides endophyticus]|uniref:Class F sortase n=1 Tax=Nocardioides endophyticus TaxID=1353775 RepID=A0ABP8YHS8_9ACTN